MVAEAADGPEWWSKPWPLHVGLFTCAAAIVLVFGNPLETQELQWFGQCLRWRFAADRAPAVERSIVHLNIDAEDLKNLPNLESEYAAAARIVREEADGNVLVSVPSGEVLLVPGDELREYTSEVDDRVPVEP